MASFKGRGRRIRPRRFVEDLLARVRDLLVLTLGGERAESVLSDDTAIENMDDLHRQAASLGLAALTQMADTINATLANMTGAISPRMRLELLAARLLAGRETGVVAQAAAPSSGMPEAGHAGGAAASESQRPSGSRRYAAQSARGRHAVEPSAAPTNPADAVVSGAASVLAEVQQAMGGPLSEGSEPAASTESKPVETQSAPSKLSNAEPSAPTQSVAQSVPQPAATDDRTPDQKWDAIVAGLPEDVRRYVDREKVPRVLLDGAKGRLWIKFDKSLSKYAFAKAVAKERSTAPPMWCRSCAAKCIRYSAPMSLSRRPRSLPTVPPRCRGASSARKSRARSTRSWCRNS